MKRYHLFFILYSLFFCIGVANAQPNERLQELEKTLMDQGFSVTHTQRNARGIEHRWMSHIYLSGDKPQISHELWEKMSKDALKALAQKSDSLNELNRQRVQQRIDLIRSTFSSLAGEASESYMYEVHNQDCDTIRLSMAWKEENTPLSSWRGDEGVFYYNAREAASLNYQRPPGEKYAQGNYIHVYTEDYPEPMSDIKSFDGESFKALVVEPCMKRAMKLKGARKYPVYWRHDEGYQDDVGGELVFKVTMQSDYGENKHTGLTTGYLYFIPKAYENEANELLATIDSLAYDYVSAHYDQTYNYKFNPRFSYHNDISIVDGSTWPDKKPITTEYRLSTYMDEDGYYFVSITTEGELWVPRDYPNLKSWINGERVERKK